MSLVIIVISHSDSFSYNGSTENRLSANEPYPRIITVEEVSHIASKLASISSLFSLFSCSSGSYRTCRLPSAI